MLEPSVWSRMRCPPVRNFDRFHKPGLLLITSDTVCQKGCLGSQGNSLAGDRRPRSTNRPLIWENGWESIRWEPSIQTAREISRLEGTTVPCYFKDSLDTEAIQFLLSTIKQIYRAPGTLRSHCPLFKAMTWGPYPLIRWKMKKLKNNK